MQVIVLLRYELIELLHGILTGTHRLCYICANTSFERIGVLGAWGESSVGVGILLVVGVRNLCVSDQRTASNGKGASSKQLATSIDVRNL